MESPAQLPFKDTTMGFDFMCSHLRTRPSSAASSGLGDQPRMSISSIVNPLSVTVVGGEFDSTPGFGQSSAEMAEPAPIWPNYLELCDYYNNPNYRTSQESFGVSYDTSVDCSFQGHMMESLPYDYSFPTDYSTDIMSSARPRSYQPEFGIAPMEAVVPSSYLVDPQKHQSYMAISPRLTESDGLVAGQGQEALSRVQIDYGAQDPLNGQTSPAPSSDIDKMELRVSPSDNKDRGSENEDPQNITADDIDGGEDDGNQPYAQLIYRALMSTPEHKMVLNEIYDWFRKTYEKFNKAKGKGWQNSIRHNLSMNGAFTKVEKSEDSSKGFIWVLEPSAIREGVKSTTRYRKVHTGRKGGSGGKAEGVAVARGQSLTAETAASSSWSSSPASSSSSARRSGKPAKKTSRANAGNKSRRNERANIVTSFGWSSTHHNHRPQELAIHHSSSSSSSSSAHLTDPDPLWNCYDEIPHIKQEHPPFLFQDIAGVSAPYVGEPFFCEPSSVGEEFACGADKLAGGFFGDMTDGV